MNTHLKQIINEIDPDIVIFGHAELIDIDTYEYIQSKI
jgi:hypothetical protein